MAITRVLLIAALLAMASAASFASALPMLIQHEAGRPPQLSAPSFFRATGRTQNSRAKVMSCNKFPRVCHVKGSPGRNCCRKRCVNLKTDGLNCGRCGRRCKFGWRCCGGKCVNAMYDVRNCGGCKHRCSKGSFCRFGMCSYA